MSLKKLFGSCRILKNVENEIKSKTRGKKTSGFHNSRITFITPLMLAVLQHTLNIFFFLITVVKYPFITRALEVCGG